MVNSTRRDFLKILGLSLAVPQDILNVLRNPDINLEEKLSILKLEYWLNKLNIAKKAPCITYDAIPLLISIFNLGFIMNGNAGVYFESDDKRYNGSIVLSINKILSFTEQFRIHSSEGHISKDGLFIPDETVRVDYEDSRLSHVHIRYMGDKAVLTDGSFIFWYDKDQNKLRYTPDIIQNRPIDTGEAIRNIGHVGDLVSEFFNLKRYEEIFKKNKSVRLYTVSKRAENNEPSLFPIDVNLESSVDNYSPISDDQKKVPQDYAMSSDFSRLLGKADVLVKGYVDKDFIPSIGNLFNIFPEITLRVTRKFNSECKGLIKIVTTLK